jgi:hypothetical protein
MYCLRAGSGGDGSKRVGTSNSPKNGPKSTVSVYYEMPEEFATEGGNTMGLQSGRSAMCSKRLRFASLREAQAIWRVLHGENAQSVSADLDVPVTILLSWLEEFNQVSCSRLPTTGTSPAKELLSESRQPAYHSS